MIHPSPEQQIIIQYLQQYQNVTVDACAGSGKSTTVLSAAASMPDRQFIQLTFNRALSAEINERVSNQQLENIKVFTYHSLLVRYYFEQGYTDQEMRGVVNADSSPIHELPPMDILAIDEAQDMSMLYFRFIVKFCRDVKRPIQLLILGDEQQALYGFNGSDTRFLTQADQIWSGLRQLHTPTFRACTLQTSYRVTMSMARFVNEIMMGKLKMLSTGRNLSPVVYVRQTNVVIATLIARNICEMLDLSFHLPSKTTHTHFFRRRRPGKNAKYSEQDIFILAQSVKHTNSIVAMIESNLAYNGISCYLPSSDENEVDERVTAHKVVFSSFCRAKGRQRKIVYVLGFDQTHFRFKSDVDPSEWTECQNDLYVACTRASEHLCVCESVGPSPYHQPLRFLKKSEEEIRNHEIVRYTGSIRGELDVIPPPKPNALKNTSATDLIRFISDSVLETIETLVNKMFVARHTVPATIEDNLMLPEFMRTTLPADDDTIARQIQSLDIPSVIQIDPVLDMYEEVSAINGVVIPYMFFDRTNPNYMQTDLRYMAKNIQTKYPYLYERVHRLPSPLTSISDYLRAGTVMSAISDKLSFRIQNLDNTEYNWLEPNVVDQCMQRMSYVFDNEPRTPCRSDSIQPPPKTGKGSRSKIQREMYEEHLRDRDNMALLHFHSDQDIVEYLFLTQGEMDPRYARIDRAMERILPGIKVRFSARLDYVSKGHIWELKCCSDLTFSHYLQVIIYAWLWRMTDIEREENDDVRDADNCMFHLFNIRTNEHYELRATTDELETIVGILLRGKYMKDAPPLDAQFVDTCKAIVDAT